jgi:hypothetical protein
MPFIKEETVYGLLDDLTIWRGTVTSLPELEKLLVIVGLTNNPYTHPLMTNGLKAAVERFEIGLGVHAYVVHRDLEAFAQHERGSRSQHQGSGAVYLYKTTNRYVCTLFQVLPPFSETSCHFHKYTTEHFFSLIGTCKIGTRDHEQKTERVYTTLAQSKLVVLPYTIHQMANETSLFAVNYLVMRRTDRPFTDATDMDDHHYVSPSPFRFTLFE